MSRVWGIIRTIRNLRAENGIKPGEYRKAYITSPKIYIDSLMANLSLIEGLARIENLELTGESAKHPGFAYDVSDGIEVYVDASIDAEKLIEERARISKEIDTKKSYIRTLRSKLKNTAFVSNAPEKVVRIEMDKLHLAETELSKLEEKYKQFDV
jgi:valyl-tRNA synthetase